MSTHNNSAVETRWSVSRSVFLIFLCIFCSITVIYYFYQHSIRYIQSYDFNNATPGIFYSQIWNWDFILQGTYALILIPYPCIAFIMYVRWFQKTPYYVFAPFNMFAFAYLLGASVYLSIQLGQSNTCASVNNPFNDFRICGVCGTLLAWSNVCFNVAPYNPPVYSLVANTPKTFQLGFSWVFAVLLGVSFFFVTTYYIKAQDAFIECATHSQQNVPSEVPSSTTTTASVLPTSSEINYHKKRSFMKY
jgi:hypothetical protein